MEAKSSTKETPKIDVSQFTAMSIAEARSTIWPFKGIKKPIGVLLENGEITIRDLAWASENAYDPHVKQAAKTILISRLFPEKIAEPLKPAKAIAGLGFTAFQRRRASNIASLALGVTAGIFLIFLFIWIWGKSQPMLTEYFGQGKLFIDAVLITVFFVIAPLLFLWIEEVYSNRSEQYAIGEDAEMQAVDSFRSLLHAPWTIFHNFEFPHRKWGDIDIVLIGGGGVWAIEVKGYTNLIRNIGDNWHFKNKFGWWKLSKHPARQARRNAARLKSFLDVEGINVGWVEAVVLWAGDVDKLIVENPQTPIWKISELPHMEDYWKKQRFSNEQVAQIVNILSKTVDEKKQSIK